MEAKMKGLAAADIASVATRAFGDGYDPVAADYLEVILANIASEVEPGTALSGTVVLAKSRVFAFNNEFGEQKLDFDSMVKRVAAINDVLDVLERLRGKLIEELEASL